MGEQFVMTEHTIVIERELDAPRDLVWKVWTDPDEVTKWWGPEHFTTPLTASSLTCGPVEFAG
jgi:uncharacterized protein YndB with AHSA1/START domain